MSRRCGIVTKRGQCRNKPARINGVLFLVKREGWPKPIHHYECTFHFNRYGFSGGPVQTLAAKEAGRE